MAKDKRKLTDQEKTQIEDTLKYVPSDIDVYNINNLVKAVQEGESLSSAVQTLELDNNYKTLTYLYGKKIQDTLDKAKIDPAISEDIVKHAKTKFIEETIRKGSASLENIVEKMSKGGVETSLENTISTYTNKIKRTWKQFFLGYQSTNIEAIKSTLDKFTALDADQTNVKTKPEPRKKAVIESPSKDDPFDVSKDHMQEIKTNEIPVRKNKKKSVKKAFSSIFKRKKKKQTHAQKEERKKIEKTKIDPGLGGFSL